MRRPADLFCLAFLAVSLSASLAACAQTALPALRTPQSAWTGPPPVEPQRLPSVPPTPTILSLPAPAPAPAAPLPPALAIPPPAPTLSPADVVRDAAVLQQALFRQVPYARRWSAPRGALWIGQIRAMLAAAGQTLDQPQLLVAVDRNPAVQQMAIVLADPTGGWRVLGGDHVSTGQAGRKDYYFTPVGVFAHTDAILDFRAEGTVNENGVRGLGSRGMRVWDFGWQYALKGWSGNGEGGDIRLQMHATDPALLEQRLGRPASEGCVRLSSAMNRFLDRFGVLDVDYERAAVDDIRYRALLLSDRTPTPLAGRLLVVFDSRQPPGALPTADSRPADLPPPEG